MDLVIIYGAPGVGKLIVATALARLTGYWLFGNHISIDWALTLFERGMPSFGRVLDKLRFAVMEDAAKDAVNRSDLVLPIAAPVYPSYRALSA